jgi:hypothetical protein
MLLNSGRWNIHRGIDERAERATHHSQVYANEYGTPFVYVSGDVNSACAGNGLYLYDITQSTPNLTYRNNKMAILLTAQNTGRHVQLDYFYDPSVTGWAACFTEGIQLVE